MVGGAAMISDEARIAVYTMTNSVFENIGELNQVESIIWAENYCGYASFQINAPITPENLEYLKLGNVLWKYGGTSAGIIEVVNSSINEDGVMSLQVKGRTLESLLERRIIKETYYAASASKPQIILDILNNNCINTDSARKIPRLTFEPFDDSGKEKVTYQNTGGNVYDAIVELAQEDGLGFEIQFHPDLEALIFRLYKGKNRSINQSDVDFVEFSNDTDDILSSSYVCNTSGQKTLALIGGEGEGAKRKYAQVVTGVYEGLDLKELFVDARDLQSTYSENGEEVTVPDLEYSQMLTQRGNEKLAENDIVQSYECQLRTNGTQYQYGVDFFLGDTVTIIDKVLNVVVDVTVTAVEEDISDKYEMIFTFGYGYPSLWTKIKQKLS